MQIHNNKPNMSNPWDDAVEVESGELVKWADKQTKVPYVGKVVVCIPQSVEERDNTRGEGKSYFWSAIGYATKVGSTEKSLAVPIKFFAPTDLKDKLTNCVGQLTRIEVLGQEEQKSGNMMTKFKVNAMPDTPENRVKAQFETEAW